MDNPQLQKSIKNRLNQTSESKHDDGLKEHKEFGEKPKWRRLRNDKQHTSDEKAHIDRMKVSKLVQDKLEDYINYGKRMERFDPGGVYRTTPRMYAYDITYKVLDHLPIGERSRSQSAGHQPSGVSHHPPVTPNYHTHSRQVTPKKEATRLAKYADQLLERFPIEKLNVIHRYRPNCPSACRSVDNGNIANYSCHFGAALNTYSYIQYYIRQGLDSGNPKHSNRLKKLQKTKMDSAKEKQDQDFKNELDELDNIDTAIGRMTTNDPQSTTEVTVFTDVAVQTDKGREEMETRLLVVQNHYVVQYLSPRQRMNVTLDCPGVRGVPRRHASRSTAATTWKARYEMVNVVKRPNTLDDTIQEINPVRYPNMCTFVI
ncbi:hypothetical protein LSAT2_029249 [Lamellibrachia satsuma]|nr:hypothetical protein LSAT2_029249 [Lamellibrachia satsuma]